MAAVNPDVIMRDKEGEIYTVRYDAVNAMLLNEFLKEHKAFLEEHSKVQKLETALEGGEYAVKRAGRKNRESQRTSRDQQVWTASCEQRPVKQVWVTRISVDVGTCAPTARGETRIARQNLRLTPAARTA